MIFVSIAFVGSAFATLPGDDISVGAAAGYAIWLGPARARRRVASPSHSRHSSAVGRRRGSPAPSCSAASSSTATSWRSRALAPFANLTWFGWTSNHVPLAGLYDWASLALVALVRRRPGGIGVEAFMRRDLGATSAIPTPSLPRCPGRPSRACLRGPPASSSPQRLAWGIGIGFFGLVIAGSGRSFFEQLDKSPDFKRLLDNLFPGVDIGSVGGFLELAFIEFGLILAGLAAATFVSYWASDETSGRLDMLLATPLQRRRWVVSGRGRDPRRDRPHGRRSRPPASRSEACCRAGTSRRRSSVRSRSDCMPSLSVASGSRSPGSSAPAAAGAAIAILTAVIWLLDVIVPAFGLPAFVHDLALSAHYGQPMLGVWDPVGIVVSLMLAVGGVAIGAWGFARRDLQA